jgi:hypothetical protein
MVFNLDLNSLSLPPAEGGLGVLRPGKDVLRCWPDEYDTVQENAAWTSALDWPMLHGRHVDLLVDCGYEPFAMNYAYNALFDHIPSGTSRDGKVVLFKADTREDHLRKQQNFYRAFAYIQQYPKQYNNLLHAALGCSKGVFVQQVVPTLFSVARKMSFLDWNLRLWEWNHTEHFLERVTFAADGFPITCCQPQNRFLARLLKSGKYKEFVVKGEYVIALGPGFPIDYTGPHIGIRHDSRMWMENRVRRAKIFRWEYGLGDKAYVGCPEVLIEFKGKRETLSNDQLIWNLRLQHYRGRVEHLIGQLVAERQALSTQWRGSLDLLAAIMKICAHMTGLQERMKGPRYDVFGPWPVCPPHVVAAFA